jgi:hypothetical protein
MGSLAYPPPEVSKFEPETPAALMNGLPFTEMEIEPAVLPQALLPI